MENLYVTDGSFMPDAGNAPVTWTIYANAFQAADRISIGSADRVSPPAERRCRRRRVRMENDLPGHGHFA